MFTVYIFVYMFRFTNYSVNCGAILKILYLFETVYNIVVVSSLPNQDMIRISHLNRGNTEIVIL